MKFINSLLSVALFANNLAFSQGMADMEPSATGSQCLTTEDGSQGSSCIPNLDHVIQSSALSTDFSFQNLKAKLEEHGGRFDKFEMKEIEPGNVTMVATEDIAKDEVVGYIPQSMHITNEIAMQTEYSKIRMEVEGDYIENEMRRFAIWILEKKADPLSPYKDYLDLLPKTYSHHWQMWSEDELAYLKGTELDK